jgi:hypothetical protein
MTTFTKDYRRLFTEAMETRNLAMMQKAFEGLAAEVGLPDPVGDAAQAARGKALAEMLNARAAGKGGGKKV